MAWDRDEARCPLADVDRRLDDLHRLWHQAEEAYFDPEAFRIAIQGAIQTARTVSFVLQKHKQQIPDFERWYERRQKLLGADALMTWMKDARNRIEKEGDLEAHSHVRAEIVASYMNEGPSIEVPAKLFDSTLALVRSVPDSAQGEHVRTQGILRIERRWIDKSLPDHELLDAVAIAYGRLANLVYAAHRQLGLPDHSFPKERAGRLPCMIGHAERRTLDVWLATGEPVKVVSRVHEIDDEHAAKGLDRYGIDPREMFAKSGIAEDHARSLFATARRMFEQDGHHVMIAFLLREGRPVATNVLRPEAHGHKYLMMRSLAHEVARAGADAVILISETWSAPADPKKPFMRAADSPQRVELLTCTLVPREGEPLSLSAEIIRQAGKVQLGETTEDVGGAHFAFAPVYEQWGKPIPTAWTSAVETLFGAGDADRK